MNKKQLLLGIFLFFFLKQFGYQRTLFVDDFNSILGNPSKEDRLLKFAIKNNFKTLLLYQLNKVDKHSPLTDPNKNSVLADFLSKAKTKFGIQKIGASGESASFFTTRIDVYNNTRKKPEEKFDIYNLEYEYWSKKASEDGGYYCTNYLEENKIPCNRNGSFTYFISNLKELKSLSKNNTHNIKVEAYVGYYTQNEIQEITKYCDRLLIHAYGKTPKLSFKTAKKSLENLYKINSKIRTSILFSTRINQLGNWLRKNTLKASENSFFNEMNISNKSLIKKLVFDGFSYHTYSYLEKSVNYFSYNNY